MCTFTRLCVCVWGGGVGMACISWVCSAGALDGSCCDLAGGGGGLAGMWVRNSGGKEATLPQAISTAPQAPPAVGCPAPLLCRTWGRTALHPKLPQPWGAPAPLLCRTWGRVLRTPCPLRIFGKIKFIVTDLLRKKTASPSYFTCKFCETFKEEIVQILYKLFQEREKEQSFPS